MCLFKYTAIVQHIEGKVGSVIFENSKGCGQSVGGYGPTGIGYGRENRGEDGSYSIFQQFGEAFTGRTLPHPNSRFGNHGYFFHPDGSETIGTWAGHYWEFSVLEYKP
jgi:hypothetical protein